jgi:hypothetical protein
VRLCNAGSCFRLDLLPSVGECVAGLPSIKPISRRRAPLSFPLSTIERRLRAAAANAAARSSSPAFLFRGAGKLALGRLQARPGASPFHQGKEPKGTHSMGVKTTMASVSYSASHVATATKSAQNVTSLHNEIMLATNELIRNLKSRSQRCRSAIRTSRPSTRRSRRYHDRAVRPARTNLAPRRR